MKEGLYFPPNKLEMREVWHRLEKGCLMACVLHTPSSPLSRGEPVMETP